MSRIRRLVLLAFISAFTSAHVSTKNKEKSRLKKLFLLGLLTDQQGQSWGRREAGDSIEAGDAIYPGDLPSTRSWWQVSGPKGFPSAYPTPKAYSTGGMSEILEREFDVYRKYDGQFDVYRNNLPANHDELFRGDVENDCAEDLAENAASLCSELSERTIYSDLGLPLFSASGKVTGTDEAHPWMWGQGSRGEAQTNTRGEEMLKELKRQMRRHAKVVHPDHGAKSAEPFRRMKDAFDYLTDKEVKLVNPYNEKEAKLIQSQGTDAERTQLKVDEYNGYIQRCKRAYQKSLSQQGLISQLFR